VLDWLEGVGTLEEELVDEDRDEDELDEELDDVEEGIFGLLEDWELVDSQLTNSTPRLPARSNF
jgi:hypothetical protein